MNDLQKNKIQKFINDKAMSDAVRELIETECLKTSQDRDVHTLAARFIAIEILNESWASLEKYKAENEKEDKQVGNVGV